MFGAGHRIAVTMCCAKYTDIDPKYVELLLLCHLYDRRGGYFTRPEVINSAASHWSRKLVYQYIKVLKARGYILEDPDVKRRAYKAVVYNITVKGEFLLNYYSKMVMKILGEVKAAPHKSQPS